jgi:hypothetical protein
MLIILLHCIPDAAIHDENRIINIFSILVQVYVIVIQQNVQAFHYLLFFLLSFQPLLLVYGYLLQITPVQMKLIKNQDTYNDLELVIWFLQYYLLLLLV